MKQRKTLSLLLKVFGFSTLLMSLFSLSLMLVKIFMFGEQIVTGNRIIVFFEMVFVGFGFAFTIYLAFRGFKNA